MTREEQVVELAGQGLTDIQIAHSLGISRHTVQTYWRRLRKRHGVSSRIQILLKQAEAQWQERLNRLEANSESSGESRLSASAELGEMMRWSRRQAAEFAICQEAVAAFERAALCSASMHYEIGSEGNMRYRWISVGCTAFGYDPSELVSNGTSWFDVAYEEDIPTMVEIIGDLRANVPPNLRVIHLYRMKAPDPRWVLDVVQHLYDADGNRIGYSGIVIDVQGLVDAGLLTPAVKRLLLPAKPQPPYVRS
jgi:DNA-binding CsgD family transcriptional regulator